MGQAFNEMVEGQPDTPTVMIEGHREQQGDRQEDSDYELIMRIDDRQRHQVCENDHDLSCNDCDHDRSHKKSFLALEDGAAGLALFFDMKEPLKDPRTSTSRAAKPQTPT